MGIRGLVMVGRALGWVSKEMMSIARGMGKEDVAHTCNGISLSYKAG